MHFLLSSAQHDESNEASTFKLLFHKAEKMVFKRNTQKYATLFIYCKQFLKNCILVTQLQRCQMNQQQSVTSSSIKQSQTSLISEADIQTTDQVKKPFIQRTFGPILPGAMRGSIFALLASAMGTGMFNLPYRIDQIGLIPYFFFVIAGGLFSYFGMYLISRLILKFKVESYSTMSQSAYGKCFRKVAEFCLIIYPWGITVCFQVIFAKFILQLLYDNFDLPFYEPGGRQDQIYSTTGQIVRICITVGAILLNLFFILKKQIGILQKVAIIGVLSPIVNLLIIIMTLFLGFTTEVEIDGKKTQLIYHGITQIPWTDLKWATMDGWDAFSQQMQGLASLIFCYVNHQLVFPLAFDLKNPNKRRLDKVFNRVHLIEVIVYTLVGLSGYLLLAEHSQVRPINALVMASIQTVTMSIGKFLMIFALFFAVPLNLFPAREVMFETFGIQKNNKNHIIISLGLAFSGTLIAIVFQKVNSYFGLLGGTAGVMMAGAIPMICYAKMIGLNSWKQKLLFGFMALISLLGIFGAILSVVVPS